MHGKQLTIGVILLALAGSIQAEYNVNGTCSVVRDGTQLASIESCQTYYVCKNGAATQNTCASGESYDKNAQVCKLSSEVDCYFNMDNPCLNKNKQHVPVVGTCNKWIYCLNGAEAGQGTCPTGQVFVNGKCTYGECAENDNGQNGGYTSICEIMPNKVIFGSTTNCAQFQVCVNNVLDGGICESPLVYNVQENLCDYEKDNTCARVTGVSIQPDGEKAGVCEVSEEGDTKPNDSQCSSYYICTSQKWIRKSCGHLYWDIEAKACNTRIKAETVATCDRCENSNKQFVNKVDDTCKEYQYCDKNVKKSEGVCDAGYYFDEKAQACVQDDASKATYQASNGACSERACAANYVCKCDLANKDPANCNCGINAGKCEVCPAGGSCDNVACDGNNCNLSQYCKVDAAAAACVECPNGVCP